MSNAGMIERRQHLCFARESREPFGVARHRGQQHFDRHLAIQLRVACAIHFPHSADAEPRADVVHAEPLT